jgi:hypothetical protein
MAPAAEHCLHVMAKAIGQTALPMKLPMARYTHPREILSSNRMMESTPDRQPQITITIPVGNINIRAGVRNCHHGSIRIELGSHDARIRLIQAADITIY